MQAKLIIKHKLRIILHTEKSNSKDDDTDFNARYEAAIEAAESYLPA